MKVQIRFFPPYDEIAGRSSEELYFDAESVSLTAFLERLIARHPGFKDYVSTESDEALRRNLMVVAGSELLTLADKIGGGKTAKVKLLPPIAGGAATPRQRPTGSKSL